MTGSTTCCWKTLRCVRVHACVRACAACVAFSNSERAHTHTRVHTHTHTHTHTLPRCIEELDILEVELKRLRAWLEVHGIGAGQLWWLRRRRAHACSSNGIAVVLSLCLIQLWCA